MELYGFFRSSAAFRVRIALNMKGLDHRHTAVNLRSAEHRGDHYRAVNPQARVPALVVGDETLIQSPAIIEYLDETQPEPPLLPTKALARARVRALANIIACDIHPLNNSGTLDFMKEELGVDEGGIKIWYDRWVRLGFETCEALLAGHPATGKFCHGDTPGLADIYLVPQVFNAKRFECDLTPYPTVMRIFGSCMEIEAFDAAQPSRQADAVG